ncbi:MAG: enoyl-CoA hydratase [Candidatus Dormibacteraeota bacterium]|nr:enoyl-CoA hydratase [Candidatus Dormibacteraeota bacterium]
MSERTETRSVLEYEVKDGVAWLRLNRPEKRNAVNAELRAALAQAVRNAERDRDVQVVVLIGRGEAFCAGADVVEFQERLSAADRIGAQYESILLGLHDMPKPTIAALNGVAAGIGMSMALCCDLRYAVSAAYLREAFVHIGLTVDGGASWLLPRLIGTGRALELMYTGDDLPAEEAERLGLVNRVLPADRLEGYVAEVAARLATGPTQALAAMKRSVIHAANTTLEEAIDFEFLLQGVMMESDEFRQRVRAFVERRS